MPTVVAYHRPDSIDDAAALLAEPNRRAMGGGTVAVPEGRRVSATGVELVDLQALGLAGIDPIGGDGGPDRLRIGAMTRLGDLMADDRVPGLLRDLARREVPSTIRNQATVGGTVALGRPDSVLVAGFLVHGAVVERHGHEPRPLAQVLTDGVGRSIITAVTVEATGRGAMAATGRTPADEPIVAAVARLDDDRLRVALTGVAEHPIEVDPADPAAGLSPPTDFRGSSEYRLGLAAILPARALASLERGEP